MTNLRRPGNEDRQFERGDGVYFDAMRVDNGWILNVYRTGFKLESSKFYSDTGQMLGAAKEVLRQEAALAEQQLRDWLYGKG